MRRARAAAVEVVVAAGRAGMDRPQSAQGPRGVRVQWLRGAARSVLLPLATLHSAGPCRRTDPMQLADPSGRRTPAPAASASTNSVHCGVGCTRYRTFLGERPAVIAGDLNSNTIWDKPGWRINHLDQGQDPRGELWPGQRLSCNPRRGAWSGAADSHWRDRTKDGPTYHIDYVFLPAAWIGKVSQQPSVPSVDWCGAVVPTTCRWVVDVDGLSSEESDGEEGLLVCRDRTGCRRLPNSAEWQPQPDVWSANYNVPFDVMVACLAAPPTGAFQVYAPAYPEAGKARIVFIPASMPDGNTYRIGSF